MKNTLLTLGMTLGIVLGAGFGPTAASADGDLTAVADDRYLGTVETAAVTGPIAAGDITYIPCGAGCEGATGGGAGNLPFTGTIETDAVTGPITVGGITYIPMSAGERARLAAE